MLFVDALYQKTFSFFFFSPFGSPQSYFKINILTAAVAWIA